MHVDALVSHTHKLKVPWLMEALVGIVLQQRPGDTVVWGVMQEDAFSRLVWGRAGAQGAPAAQAKRKLQISGAQEKKFESVR